MRVRLVCAVVCNALLGAAVSSGCAQGSNGITGGGGGGNGGASSSSTTGAVTSTTSTTTTSTTSTTTTTSSTTGAGTGGSGSVSGTGGQGLGGGTSTSGTGGSNGCTHDVCVVGAPLDPSCDACTASVCAQDTYCCAAMGQWDTNCVANDVPMYCAAMTCAPDGGTSDAGDAGDAGDADAGGNSCAHDVCTTGVALNPSCSPCAASVCSHDSFCCSTHWDSICAGSDVVAYCAATTCGADGGAGDAGATDGGGDAGSMDAGATDSGPMDAGATDAGSADGGGPSCLLNHLVISEIRSRGAGGANDEFIELYNPTAAAVVLDNTWKINGRSTTSTSYTPRWIGTGKTIPAHGHFLIAGSMYTQAPAGDELLTSGITDASSVVLGHGASVVDAVCYGFDATTLAAFNATYLCAGTPASNLPHDNSSTGMSNSDASIERKPGGSAGNCTDTGDNAADFGANAPATPQSSASPPTP